MKSIAIASMAIVVITALSGCVASNLVGIGDTELVLDFTDKGDRENNAIHIVKTTSQLADKCSRNRQGQRYMLWSTRCNLGRLPPSKLTIQYARWKPYADIPKPSEPHMIAFGHSLPASAWQTLTINPRKLMQEVESRQTPESSPGYLPKAMGRKNMVIYLDIEPNGKISVRNEASYAYIDNSFRNNWH